MNYISEQTSAEREKEWLSFEKTGSIVSYLKYKGIYINDADGKKADDGSSAQETRDGELIGYY